MAVDYHLNALDDEDAYVEEVFADGDEVVPYRIHRPSLLENACAVDDDREALVRSMDPYCAFSRNDVVVSDEDVIASDLMMDVELLLVNASDQLDVASSFHSDPYHDAETSFCTCEDVEVGDGQDDVD